MIRSVNVKKTKSSKKIVLKITMSMTRDMDAVNKPWDASTCSMHYAVCLGDRLWTMITREQNRVCVFCFFVLLRN